jgi:hypothetical protein
MKVLIGLLLLSSFFELKASEIRVKKMSADGELDRSFVLKTNLSEKVVLDCQSFIQGLRIGEYETAYTYFLDPEECEGLQKRVRGSLRRFQNHCIDVERDIRADYSCH